MTDTDEVAQPSDKQTTAPPAAGEEAVAVTGRPNDTEIVEPASHPTNSTMGERRAARQAANRKAAKAGKDKQAGPDDTKTAPTDTPRRSRTRKRS